MKLPNGFGSVHKLSGKRRKPFIAQKTIGWSDDGRQVYKVIGYFEKRQEALNALIEYNNNPYDLDNEITFSEVYDKWKNTKFNSISKSAINGYNAAFEISKQLHDIKFTEIKTITLQNVIDTCNKGHGTLRKIKTLYNQLFKFAMQNDIVSKDYSTYVEIGVNKSTSSRVPFSQKEIDRLFEVTELIDYVDTILIMIYTGLRIGELLLIKKSDVDLINKTITGGIKTAAGKNRVVPINHKILELIKNRMTKSNEYLIENSRGTRMKYDNYYRDHWISIMEQLNMNHKPHDARHTFATLMSNADANPVSIKKLIGHSSYETTEKIYTHKDVEDLRKAIESI